MIDVKILCMYLVDNVAEILVVVNTFTRLLASIIGPISPRLFFLWPPPLIVLTTTTHATLTDTTRGLLLLISITTILYLHRP